MELQVTSEVQDRLSRFTSETGCSADDLVNDAILGHLDELTRTRQTLNNRYDDLQNGRVKGIDGETARRMLLEKNNARRQQRG
jgi:hypothetical protein